MPIEDFYMENTGHYCERCGTGDKNGIRIVRLKQGPMVMYMCGMCMKGIVDWIEVPITYTNPQWIMSRQDLSGWVDPSITKAKSHADNLRQEMSEWDKEMIDLGKDLMKINISRNDYYLAMRTMIKNLFQIVEEHLKRIA